MKEQIKEFAKKTFRAILPAFVEFIGGNSRCECFDNNSKRNVIQIPYIPIRPLRCAAYAASASEEIFGTEFNGGMYAAWNLRHHYDSERVQSNLENAKPGNLITFYRPESKFNTIQELNTDEKKQRRNATHVGVFIGRDKAKKPLILDQFIFNYRVSPLDELEKCGLVPVEVIKGAKKLELRRD